MTIWEALEITALALKVNSLDMRKQDVSGNLPTAFIDFSGHVAELTVEIYKSGWRIGEKADRRFEFATSKPLNQWQMIEYRAYIEGLMQKVDPASEGSTGAGE